MLDAMSCFPGPPKSSAVDYIVRVLRNDTEFESIDSKDMRFVVEIEYDAFGEFAREGSQASWLSITSRLLMENVRKALRKKFAI